MLAFCDFVLEADDQERLQEFVGRVMLSNEEYEAVVKEFGMAGLCVVPRLANNILFLFIPDLRT